jgi:hypothetical protein
MASIKLLKKEINYILGDLIEQVYHWEASSQKMNSEEGNKLIDKCIQVYDELIELINNKEVELKKEHFTKIRTYLDEKTEEIQKEIKYLSN